MINVPGIIEPERVPERVKKKSHHTDEEIWVANPLRHQEQTEPYHPPIMLKGSFKGISAKILVDSGSSGNFISKSFVKAGKLRLGYLKSHARKRIRLANGASEIVNRCMNGNLVIGSHQESLQLAVIGLQGYDFILGMPWLAKHNPEVDWQHGIVTVVDPKDNSRHVLPTIESSESDNAESELADSADAAAGVTEISALQAKRLLRKRDPETQYYLAVVRPHVDEEAESVLSALTSGDVKSSKMSETSQSEAVVA